MKYLILLISLIMLLSCSNKRPTPEIPLTWMPDPTLTVDNREVTNNSVVFLGNSLTHIPIWEDFFPNVETANRGIGGNTTFQVIQRLSNITKHKPKKIFLMIGANDLNAGIPHSLITQNQRTIIQRIKKESPDTELFVQSILPFGKDVRVYFPHNVPKTYVNDIKELNKALILVCLTEKVKFLNVYEVMVDKTGHLKQEYTIDQVHLSEDGYKPWISYIKKYVETK